MNQNESVAFLQWLEGVVEYRAASDRFIFQGKSFKRKGRLRKQRVDTGRKFIQSSFSRWVSLARPYPATQHSWYRLMNPIVTINKPI
ncbi:hypothetical protein [Escherichia phage ECML-117]|uniref:Uncharacterized protein n=1 Tax=Escherichia phage ECML-117 TaxID=1204521 RepID=I7B2M6_9CAUD|nr:hypothetical protein PI34_gp21 [Escherichia phage ECML-117]AFO10454.1 hypothetical protein [Escherichia phage ECML-117]